MANNASFLEFFKGIYITVDNGEQLPLQAGLLYFNMTSSSTKMVLYYHDTINAPVEALSLDLPIDQGIVRYTTVGGRSGGNNALGPFIGSSERAQPRS